MIKHLVMVLIFGVLGTTIFGDPSISDGEPVGPMAGILREIGLSEDQRVRLHDVKETHKLKKESLEQRLSEKNRDLKSALDEYDSDRDHVFYLIHDIAGIHEDLMELRAEHLFEMKDILTEAQYEEFKSLLKEKLRDRHGHKKKPRLYR